MVDASHPRTLSAIRRSSSPTVAASCAASNSARPSSKGASKTCATSSELRKASTKDTQKDAQCAMTAASHVPWNRRNSSVPCLAMLSRLSEQ